MLQTDYKEVSTILFAYPERYYNGYDDLVPFYDELITLIPNDFKIWIITNNNQSIKKLEEKFSYKKINFLGLKGWDDIFIRDSLGFIRDEYIYKPNYYPCYCKNTNDKEYYRRLNFLSRTIAKECLKKEVIDINLVIDGGNLVLSDTHVYLTDKVYENNCHLSNKEIDYILLQNTGLKPVVVENNKADSIGHMDAYLAFLDKDTAIIPSYPSFPFLKDDLDFLKLLDEELKVNDYKRVTLYERPIDEGARCGCSNHKGKPCFYSARGNYINFLRLNNTIILPEYNLPTKKEPEYYNKTNQNILENLGFEVLRINCDKLAKFGGVLHCISFTA